MGTGRICLTDDERLYLKHLSHSDGLSIAVRGLGRCAAVEQLKSKLRPSACWCLEDRHSHFQREVKHCFQGPQSPA